VRPHGNPITIERRVTIASLGIGELARGQVFAGIVVGKKPFGLHAVHIERIDRNPLLVTELVVQIAPIRSEVRAVEQPRHHLVIANLQHVARTRPSDEDRSCHDVDAGITVRFGDVQIKLPDPLIHQQLWGVAGMMGNGLDLHEIAALDAQCRREAAVEITPMHGLHVRWQDVKHYGTRC
jgi:hypothetical protein